MIVVVLTLHAGLIQEGAPSLANQLVEAAAEARLGYLRTRAGKRSAPEDKDADRDDNDTDSLVEKRARAVQKQVRPVVHAAV
jgi:hypothetical protein